MEDHIGLYSGMHPTNFEQGQTCVERTLQYRLARERLLSAISSRILGVELGQIAAEVRGVLLDIGRAFGADSSFIYLLTADGTSVSLGYEWHVADVEPILEGLSGQSLESFPWLLSRLRQFKSIHASAGTDLPTEAGAEMAVLQKHGLRAVSLIPLASGETLIGFFGLRTRCAFPAWDGEDLVLLKVIAEILISVLLRMQMEERLAAGRNLLQALMDNVPHTIYAKDSVGRFLMANAASAAVVGITTNDILGKTDFDLFPSERARQYWADEETVMRLNQPLVDRVEVVPDHTGRKRWFSTTKVPLRDRLGHVVGVVGIGRDITESKQAEEKLFYLSTHDAVTGLYNRAYFEEALVQLGQSDRYPVSVIVMDIDGMKRTNDTQGHAAGDELLRRTAAVLRLLFRDDDVVARIGGDEFAVLLPQTDERVALSALDRLRLVLAEHNSSYGREPLSLSVGVTTAPEYGLLTQTIRHADQQMYRDKQERRNQWAHPAEKDESRGAHAHGIDDSPAGMERGGHNLC